MKNLKSTVLRWFEQGLIAEDCLPKALVTAQESQANIATANQWSALISLLLNWLGGLLLGSGIVFFVAANWQTMGAFARFALVEFLLLCSITAYVIVRRRAIRAGDHHGFGFTSANAILLISALIIGSLLALVGQTYQTGADPWQLFAIWSLFILPLAFVSGNELLWLLLAGLVNLALVLYFQTFPGSMELLFGSSTMVAVLFALNLCLHLACCLLNGRFFTTDLVLKARFNLPLFQQLTILAALAAITMLSIEALFDEATGLWLIVYTALICLGYLLYNYKLKDIFPLAIGGYSLVTVVNCLFIRVAVESSDLVSMFFLVGFSIIGSTTGITLWLKQRHKAFSKGAQASC